MVFVPCGTMNERCAGTVPGGTEVARTAPWGVNPARKGQPVSAIHSVDPEESAFDTGLFRRVSGRFTAGITVVTTRSAAGLRGITANSFTTVSLNPPLVLFCLTNTSSFTPLIEESGVFAVNVLAVDDEFLSDRFANRAPLVDVRFTGVPHHFEESGAPVLDTAIAWFDCRVWANYDGGDHRIVVGEVLSLGEAEGEPLVYYRSSYARVAM